MMVWWVRTFAVTNGIGRSVNCFREFISDLVAWFAFVTGYPSEDGGGLVSSAVKYRTQTN